MGRYVVDTNVCVVANGMADQAGVECRFRCIEFLQECRGGLVYLDANGLALQEYSRHLSRSGQPGLGDAFFKYIHENQAVESICRKVRLTVLEDDPRMFEEFPDDVRLSGFDASDRKWVAIAIGSGDSPEICNAVDSDWEVFGGPLREAGVSVRQLCMSEGEEQR